MTKSISLFGLEYSAGNALTKFNFGRRLAAHGKKVLMTDLDPQCGLTAIVLEDSAIDKEKIEQFYSSRKNLTMGSVINAVMQGISAGNYIETENGGLLKTANENLYLLPGHIGIADLDFQISLSLKIASGAPAIKNIPASLPEILQGIARRENIDYMILNLGANFGGVNEVALMSSDYFIIAISPDYFCLQGISLLEKNITRWHTEIERFKIDHQFDNRAFPIRNRPVFLGTVWQRGLSICEKSLTYWTEKIREAMFTKLVPSLKKN